MVLVPVFANTSLGRESYQAAVANNPATIKPGEWRMEVEALRLCVVHIPFCYTCARHHPASEDDLRHGEDHMLPQAKIDMRRDWWAVSLPMSSPL